MISYPSDLVLGPSVLFLAIFFHQLFSGEVVGREDGPAVVVLTSLRTDAFFAVCFGVVDVADLVVVVDDAVDGFVGGEVVVDVALVTGFWVLLVALDTGLLVVLGCVVVTVVRFVAAVFAEEVPVDEVVEGVVVVVVMVVGVVVGVVV